MAWLARTRMLRGRFRDAVKDGERALAAAVAAGDPFAEGEVLNTLGMAQVALGQVDEGVARLRRSVEIARENDDPDGLAFAYTNLSDWLNLRGRTVDALETAKEGLAAIAPSGQRGSGLDDVDAVGAESRSRRLEGGASALGGAAVSRGGLGADLPAAARSRPCARRGRRGTGGPASRGGRAAGRGVLGAAVDRGNRISGCGLAAAAAPDPFGLTPRERQVLALISEGATNRQIGAALFMAEKTASVHVSRILTKLGVRSRTQAAAIAHRQRLN